MVLGFFSPHQQRFPKKEIFPVLLRAVLVDRRDKQRGSRLAASNRPPESQAVQTLLSNSASTSGPHCLNLANERFFCGFV